MKTRLGWMAIAVMAAGLLTGVAVARSQQAAPAGGAGQDAANGPVANPVSTTVKGQLARFQKNMVGAAELMPAEKYGFKPTAEMNTFGHVVMHIAQSNYTLCSKLSGSAAPDTKLAETDGKDKLVAGLKDSFAFCTTVLANADDAKLGEQIPLFGGRMASRAAAWIALSDGWNDHYGALAVYLRLNGILPPSAQPGK
jgi:DinB family protein